MNIKFINNHKEKTILLLPGWAMDFDIFGELAPKFNYLIPEEFIPNKFAENLLKSLKNHHLSQIKIIGFSLGGFVGYEFTKNYPEYVEELVLIGIRPKYPKELIENIKLKLNKNKIGFLRKFYQDCFDNSVNFNIFKEKLLKSYLDFSLELLIDGLDYLATHEININGLKKIKKLKLIHGKKDKIAPIEEVLVLKETWPELDLQIIDAGHCIM